MYFMFTLFHPNILITNKIIFFYLFFTQNTIDGNVTISELTFLPAPEDNGKSVTCSVSTDQMTGGGVGLYLKDSKILDIKRKLSIIIYL